MEIERLEDGDVDAFIDAGYRAFAEVPSPALRQREAAVTEPERAWWALADGRPIATAALISGALRFPGGDVPTPMLTAIGVHRTHRRRGLLTRLVAAALDDARERGEPWVGLFASEGAIYGHVGFGPASRWSSVRLPRRRSTLRPDVRADARLRALDPADAAPVLADLYARARDGWLAMPTRTPDWLAFQVLADPLGEEPDGHPLEVLVAEVDGAPAGYAVARVEPRFAEHRADGVVHVTELVAIDPRAEASLWHALAETDLTEHLLASHLPLDPPLRHLLADPRAIEQRSTDGLWLRPTDLVAALAARGWHGDGRLVLRVVDRAAARWAAIDAEHLSLDDTVEIHVECGSARVTRTTAPPDLTLDAEALGAIALGDTRPPLLRAAGRLLEHTDGVTTLLDALLGSAAQPWCPEIY